MKTSTAREAKSAEDQEKDLSFTSAKNSHAASRRMLPPQLTGRNPHTMTLTKSLVQRLKLSQSKMKLKRNIITTIMTTKRKNKRYRNKKVKLKMTKVKMNQKSQRSP
jgi:hypothetical protein